MDEATTNSAPLFQNTDAQEQAYAPEEVPGSRADQVGAGTTGTLLDDAGQPSSSTAGGAVPLVPVRGDLSQQPVLMPPATETTGEDRSMRRDTDDTSTV